MQQIADWLIKLGMSEYAQRFAENDIDIAVLPHLTDQHLKDLGVSLGHRLKMLHAIAQLGGAAPATTEPAPVTEPRPQDTAERRQLTVMFCDLVGSTALSARLDPEDLRGIIGAYHRCCTELVERNGGFVAKYLGDGLLAYFGYPQAHEHDAERAVRAGLALVEAVPKLETAAGSLLQVRVGIATGLVVVGDLIGAGAAQEQAVIGETPNLAARLQGIAEPNTIVIADSTRRLLGNLFELEDLGLKELKGIAGPARAWAALRASSVESRFDALHTTGLTALVGREEEMDLLFRRWSRAKTGEGKVVLISGEAGIGKSRLTAALLERLATEPHTCLRYFCSPHHTDSAFHPIIGQLERAAGLAHDDKPQVRLDKLDAVLAQTSTQDAALLAEMLSLPNDGRYPALDLIPEQRRQRTLEALTGRLARLASQQPVLMIFEDAHWTDPTSLEAFGRTVDRIKTLRALLIVTFRPEFIAPWVGQSHVTSLTLNRLGEVEATAIIARLVGNQELPADVMAEIVERTDGIPLFVEEMTKAVLEAESEGAARRTVAAVPSPALAVPASLHASLMARLDRLGSAKELAQIGAAIGREFSHALLTSVVRQPEADMGSALDRLIQAGLLFRQGVPPHASYLFKHALVQDAAYGTLLREPRRALHARIAEALESQFAEIVESRPELLARHCTEAGLIDKAASLWGKAGQQSLTRSAPVEAEVQLRKGLTLLSGLPDDAPRQQQELEFQIALGRALMATKGHASAETGKAYIRARQLCERLNEPPQLVPVLFGQCVYHLVRGEYVLARQHAAAMRQLADARNDLRLRLMGCRLSGQPELFLGEFAAARAHLERGLALFDPEDRPFYGTLALQDARVMMLGNLSGALVPLGYLDQARARDDEALMDARRLAEPFTLAMALVPPGCVLWCVPPAVYLQRSEELATLAAEQHFPMSAAVGMVNRGWCMVALGQEKEGIDQATQGLVAFRATGARGNVPALLTLLADAYRMAGQPEAGLARLDEAEELIGETQERCIEAEMHRLRGELLKDTGDRALAEANFRKALGLAQRQSAKLFELRAVTSLARLWRDQGKHAEARDLLAPVYGWFTEGLDTPILKEAKALLDELAQ